MSLKYGQPDTRGAKLVVKEFLTVTIFGVLFFSPTAFSAPTDALTSPAAAKGEINAKLDRIVKNHEEIIKQLEEMKKELYIIKIRASR